MIGKFHGVCATCGTRLTGPDECAWCDAQDALRASGMAADAAKGTQMTPESLPVHGTPQTGVQRVVLTLPHPPASLSPNGRAHWRTQAVDKTRTRTGALLMTRNVIWQEGITSHPWPAARMDICWMFAGRQPDDDNVVARCKSIRDGIADGCLVSDDKHITIGTVTMERVPKAQQGVVLTLTRLDAQP